MQTGYVWHPWYGWHDTGTGAGLMPSDPTKGIQPFHHFENSPTKTRLHELVEASGLGGELERIAPEFASRVDLERVHERAYMDRIEHASMNGGGDAGDGHSPFGAGGYEVARLAAGGTMAALEAVLDGEVDNAYALVRPPGHHARTDTGMGFCLVNNIAVAIAGALDSGAAERVAMVDWDVHHGNGTQQVFYHASDVLTISLHQDRNYPPDSGLLSETGAGAGAGTALNIPLPPGTGHGGYLAAFDEVVLPALRRYQPDVIVVACGFDSAAADPLGRQMLYGTSYRQMTQRLMAAADELCDGRLVVSHEGGYNAPLVPFLGLAVIETLSGHDSGITDPFEDSHSQMGQQDLQPHQYELVTRAAALVPQVPGREEPPGMS